MVKDVLQQRHVVVAAFCSPFEVLMHHELPSQPFWLLTLFLLLFLLFFFCSLFGEALKKIARLDANEDE